MVGDDGGAFFMVEGDASNVLRCRHGHTTNTLTAHAREHRCDAESAARLHGDSAAGGVALQRLGRLTAAGDP